ncbi:MAG: hypothetical protein IKQ35_04750 [Bacilli bacterium]|nr:hypothetical protein [Bacilli bacterium]
MKKKVSIILNVLVVIFEIVGFMISINTNNCISIEYFTEDSNILALFASSLYLFFVINKKKIPKWLSILKYIAAVCLTVTFLVVLFILAPMYNFNYYYFLLYGTMLFHHFICPIIFVVAFTCFDKVKIVESDKKYGIGTVVLYAIVLIILNILKVVDGPYPFLRVLSQPIYISIFWAVLILGLAYGISVMIYRLYRR